LGRDLLRLLLAAAGPLACEGERRRVHSKSPLFFWESLAIILFFYYNNKDFEIDRGCARDTIL